MAQTVVVQDHNVTYFRSKIIQINAQNCELCFARDISSARILCPEARSTSFKRAFSAIPIQT